MGAEALGALPADTFGRAFFDPADAADDTMPPSYRPVQ